MVIDEVISWPELAAVLVLGLGFGWMLHRRHRYGREGLAYGLMGGSLFFLLLIIARLILFPETPEFAALRTWTWALYTVFVVTIMVTITLLRRGR